MSKKRKGQLPEEVERVRGRLEAWRGQRRRGQRIPEGLWNAAVAAAQRHGVAQVSRALHVDYNRLKQRTQQDGSCLPGVAGAEPVFVEWPSVGQGVCCVVELEKGNGAKLRVSVGDAATVDWCRVKEAFLGA
jgi:hypothetical protein